ncbi:MAG: sel1 repeat family protein, partial [Oscillospiraceae bacterium]|nr:sel1 repeat family protein [Oscillospiraceae bacterium]
PNNAYELEEQAKRFDNEEKHEESFKIRLKAADMENVISISNLGWHYQYGYGVEQDYEKAFSYYKKAADMGNAWAQNKTGIFYNNGYGCEENEAMAFSYFMKAAEQEESEAEYWVGMCYKNSWGVSEDYEKAYSWFLKAHKNGYVGGTRELAYCLWTGSGCAANKGRAKGLWNEAANKDDAQSACYLGDAHIEEGNNNKAFFYLNKAYKLGWMDAASNLSLCLEMGWGTQKNYRRAVEVLEANLDEHPEYYVQLGKIFFPLGTEYQNYTKAAQYFQKAVDHEYVEGYFMLGMCYSEGYGVPKNKEKAKELLQVAADNGHADAQELLNDISKKEGYIDTAKKIGKGALGLLGAFAQGYAQASSNMYY